MGGQGLWGINQPRSLILIFLAAIFHGKHKTWVLISHQPLNPSGLFQNPTLKCMFSVPASLYRPQIRTFPRWIPGYRLLQTRESWGSHDCPGLWEAQSGSACQVETKHLETADAKSRCSSETPFVWHTLGFTNLTGSFSLFVSPLTRPLSRGAQAVLTSVAAHRAFWNLSWQHSFIPGQLILCTSRTPFSRFTTV